MNGLFEILSNKAWMVSPDFAHGVRKVLEQNLNGHLPFEKTKHPIGAKMALDGNVLSALQTSSAPSAEASGGDAPSNNDKQYVNIMYVDGPITRNGGGCSYGSIDYRDRLISLSSDSNCVGHIFYIDTPGGSAWAKNDFQQGIEYARNAGQPVLAFVDGLCASAGMYLASMCDERYYMHPEDEIGCIGVMACFYTEKDGQQIYTGETYHELYDPESFDKNKEFREVADGETENYVKFLAQLGVEFRADVKKACPAATDEHLHGALFSASHVKGILMDDQSTLEQVVQRVYDLANGAEPIKREAAKEPSKGKGDKSTEESIKSDKTMAKDYNSIASACGVERFENVTEDGVFMNTELLDTLEDTLAQKDADKASLIEANEKVVAAQTEGHNEAVAKLNTEHEEALAALKAEHESALAELQTKLNDAEGKVKELETELQGSKDAVAAAEQTIADRDATIKELTEKPADEEHEAPANNGEGMQGEQSLAYPEYDDNLSPMENQKRLEAYKAQIK